MTFIKSTVGMGYFGLAYNWGDSSETEGKRGIAHLMEHLVTKTFDHLQPLLTRNDVDFNAMTYPDRTIVYFRGLEDILIQVLPQVVPCLLTMIPLWQADAFAAEKSTVLQEIGDCSNDPIEGTLQNLFRKHYNYYGGLGFAPDVEKFSYGDSLLAATSYKVPSQVVQVGSKPYMAIDTDPVHWPAPLPLQFSLDWNAPQEQVPNEGKTLVGMLGSVPADITEVAKLQLAIDCLTGGLEAPLYQEIREKRGLSYFSSGYMEAVGNSGVPIFYANTSSAEELMRLYQSFFHIPFTSWVPEARFNDCLQGLQIKYRKAQLLPFVTLGLNAMLTVNPYDAVNATYDEIVALAEKYLNETSLHQFASGGGFSL